MVLNQLGMEYVKKPLSLHTACRRKRRKRRERRERRKRRRRLSSWKHVTDQNLQLNFNN